MDLDSETFNLRDYKPAVKPFDIFISMKRVEWDTLMLFYGVLLCVGGLGALGYLALVSDFLYGDLGPMAANILIGVLSAVVDNIPLMFAVLSVNPDMSVGQWLLITLTAPVYSRPGHRIPTPELTPEPPQTTGAASPLRAPARRFQTARRPPGPPD